MLIIIMIIFTIIMIIMILPCHHAHHHHDHDHYNITLTTWPCRHPSQDCQLLEFYETRQQEPPVVRALPDMMIVIILR